MLSNLPISFLKISSPRLCFRKIRNRFLEKESGEIEGEVDAYLKRLKTKNR
jgi:hypothetical protein